MRADLRADCASCVGLCCVALDFAASADFAFGKPAGVRCRHLQDDHRCGIHDRLRESGMRGCTVYDCLGAGQRIARLPIPVARMYALLPVVRQLHEMIAYLDEAARRAPSGA